MNKKISLVIVANIKFLMYLCNHIYHLVKTMIWQFVVMTPVN